MHSPDVKPLPKTWLWLGVVTAVAGAGNLALWIYGLIDPPSEPSDIFQWWVQLFLGVLFCVMAPYYVWRSRQDRRRLAAAPEEEG